MFTIQGVYQIKYADEEKANEKNYSYTLINDTQQNSIRNTHTHVLFADTNAEPNLIIQSIQIYSLIPNAHTTIIFLYHPVRPVLGRFTLSVSVDSTYKNSGIFLIEGQFFQDYDDWSLSGLGRDDDDLSERSTISQMPLNFGLITEFKNQGDLTADKVIISFFKTNYISESLIIMSVFRVK